MIMEIRKIWPRIFYGWLVLFMISGPLLGQDGPNVTMVLHPNDNPQMISRFGWDQQIFWVRVTNNEPSSIQYRIVYRLQISNSSITPGTIMTGRTRVGTKQWDGENGHGYLASHSGENIYNNDYSRIEELNVDIGSGPEFNDIVSRTGTLPPGDYELIVELQAKYWSDDDELYFIDPPPVETRYHEWRIVIPVPPLLFIPSDESVIEVTNPTFSWYSLRTASGIKFLYNIRICLVEEGQSKEEAMDNLTHWTNDWDIDHTHISGQDNISWIYPPEADPFANGREYVWQVSTYNEDGLYGWDVIDPAVSEIWIFKFGKSPQLISPGQGVIEPGILPSFTWAQVVGAMNYEIWFGDREDPLVEIPIWNAVLNNSSYTYSADAPALIPLPSFQYYWKVRANPLEPIPGAWSEEVFGFAIAPLQLQEPGTGTSVPSLTPEFTWDGPDGVGGYEFRISLADDGQVENPIFIQNVTSETFTYPGDAQALAPGGTYNWKVIVLDQNDNYMGTADEYLDVFNFSVDPIVLSSPSEGSSVNSLTPVFSWEAPTGIPAFEFQLFYSENTSAESPDFSVKINSNSYQLNASEFLLTEGNSYFWKIIALDGDDLLMGNLNNYSTFVFNVVGLDLTIPVVTASISDETPNLPTFSLASMVENADGYSIKIASTEEMSEIIWESDILASLPYTLTPGDVNLDFNTTYFVQGQAYQGGVPFGDIGTVFRFTTGNQPGADEQPEITVTF